MSRAAVLIVDDDPTLLQALSDALELRMRGLTVDTCESASLALERLSSTDYDAIVADVKMPGMDGLELLARIRELKPDTPTLLITGHGEHDLAVQALRGGAQDYVQKPIDRDYFVGSLTHAIERHRLSRRVARQKERLAKQTRRLEECLEERTEELRELYQREALARAELEKATAELESSRRRRDELVSMIAHDLSTPLTTVRGYVELLTRPDVSTSVRDRARAVILSETARMVRLVQDLVEDSEADRQGFSIKPASCDLVDILREQIEVAAARAQNQAIKLDAPARLPLRCDRARVAQVIANLLNNALAYAPQGEIGVRAWRKGQHVQVAVTDSGPGIPAESLDTIFEPHVRLRRHKGKANGSSPNGAGLGLTIAREIVEAHDGRIWVDSQPGKGSTFSVVLPVSVVRQVRPSSPRGARSGSVRRRAGSRIHAG